MPIKVVHDGTWTGEPRENCAFCGRKTRYWFAKKDVAVCPACAQDKNARQVPSKAEWIASQHPLQERGQL